MKKRTQKKLSLAKETVKDLQSHSLAKVAGGAPLSHWTDCDFCISFSGCGEIISLCVC